MTLQNRAMNSQAVHVLWNPCVGSISGRFTPWMPHGLLLRVVLTGLFWGVLLAQPVHADDQHKRLMSLVSEMELSYARVNDYVAVFHKQERVNGRLLPEETILFKFQKPFKIYMKWIKEPFEGREALYVEGKYGNKLIAHKGGFFGFLTLSLDPRGSLAMEGNRHPVTEAGLGHLVEGLRRDIESAVRNEELEITRLDEERIKDRPCVVVEARSNPRSGRKYYASRMILHVDKGMLLPVGVSFYDENDQLFERYAYTDLKVNVGLTAMDFSRYNDAYRF
jgi:hypothetical protein